MALWQCKEPEDQQVPRTEGKVMATYAARYANASLKSEVRIYNNRLRRERIIRRQRMILVMVLGMILGLVVLFASSMVLQAKSDSSDIDYKYYTSVEVHSGDTLWGFAQQYREPDHYKNMESYISEVRAINHMAEDEDVIAGTNIILPYYSPEFK